MVYIFLADGFEDMEAVQPRDFLLRAGIKVKTVGVGAKTVKSAFGLAVTAVVVFEKRGRGGETKGYQLAFYR